MVKRHPRADAAVCRDWLAELRLEPCPEEGFGQSVVQMGFTAPSDRQWEFILAALAHAESDDELGHIAAGPIECLLGWHGESYIDRVEQQASTDAKFCRALTGVWKYLMKDEVWERVKAIQERVPHSSWLPAGQQRLGAGRNE